mmetsp:Transcript_2747/g.4977  ORF Transcript_2747/g.4977 Transcript_2747/m.4977 type:complete len:318 (+) Transcript_2747:225-1178(+)
MLQILAHADLTHETVFVPVHSRQLAHVIEGVLQSIRQLVRVDISQAILHVRIYHQLGKAQNFSREMEGIPETALLTFLRRERFRRLEIKVVIQVEIIQLLTIDEQVEHVVTLPTNLQPHLHPIQFCTLKELRRLETFEEHLFVLLNVRTRVKLVQHPILEQFLIRHANLRRVIQVAGNAFPRPVADQGHVDGATRPSRSEVKRPRGEVQGNSGTRSRGGQRDGGQERAEAHRRSHLFVDAPQGSVGSGEVVFLVVQIVVHQPDVVLLLAVVILVRLPHQWEQRIFVEFVLFSHDRIVISPPCQFVIAFVHSQNGIQR